jgi:hypothetical protein
MRTKPSLLQIRGPSSVLQERLRVDDHVRRGRGTRGPPRGLPGLQRLRTGIERFSSSLTADEEAE